jgi:threonyl-tRNA synthetase
MVNLLIVNILLNIFPFLIDSLQRMYGISFPTAKQLKEYQELVEKMKTSDHRLIGKQLNFFFFDTQMSPGSCFFLPHGAKIYNRLEQFIRVRQCVFSN